MLKHFLKITVFCFIIVLIVGCDSSESHYIYDSNTTETEAPNSLSPKLSGVLVDGYIELATVCIDKNKNGLCSTYEASASTNSSGEFSIDKPQTVESGTMLVASGGIDTSTNKSFNEKFVYIISEDELDNNTSVTVSPITDLVARYYINTENKDSTSLNDAKTKISEILGIRVEQVDSNPMKNIDIFSISQDIQYTKNLILKLLEKNISTLTSEDIDIVQNKIKDELIIQNFNIQRTIIALEIKLSVTIPENQKQFVIDQTTELKNTLNSLSKDTSLSIENLNRLQQSLSIKHDEIYLKLENSDEVSNIDVVTLNITPDSLTQTIFNTINAELDESACKRTAQYNELYDDFFTVSRTTDDLNAISIKSTYDNNDTTNISSVTIYYPTLESSKTQNSIVVFEDNYYFSFDESWINNSNKTVYIKTPQDERGLYGCYRYELNSTSVGDIVPTKVFRYNEL